jgi:hypothetical protein
MDLIKMKMFFITAIVLFCSLFANVGYCATSADILIDFETGADGNVITGAILNSSTHGSGGTWSTSKSPMTASTISTSGEKKYSGNIIVGGTSYADSSSTRGVKWTANLQIEYSQFSFSSSYSSVSAGFFFYAGIPTGDPTYYNPFNVGNPGNEYCAPQWRYNGIHLETKGGDSADVNVSSYKWYWITIKYVQNGTSYMSVYDPTNWSLVGTVTHTLLDFPATVMQFGQMHAQIGQAGSYYYFDDILIDWTTATFPLLPPTSSIYYVDKDSIGGVCSDGGSGTLITAPWCTISKANSTLTAGDTLYIRAGTYPDYIAPSNSGISGSRITYINYGTETVTIAAASYGIYMSGKSYLTVQGISFYNLDQFLWLINGCTYNVIAYCNFDQVKTIGWSGSKIYQGSTYNWVHHCRFSKYGYYGGGDDVGSLLDVGNELSATDFSNYNLIENNTFFSGGHHLVGVFGMYNSIRNNYFHHEDWLAGPDLALYGNRCVYMSGYAANAAWNLLEGNRIGYAGNPVDNKAGTSGLSLSISYNIVRFNSFYFNDNSGVTVGTASGYVSDASYNKIYNNSFLHNGFFSAAPTENKYQMAFVKYGGSYTVKYNQIKNNLYLYNNLGLYGTYGGILLADQTFANEWDGDSQGDPKFVNASATPGDPFNSAFPDLTLQASSPAINQAGVLTTVAAADSGTGGSLVVTDASYFQDGSWGPSGALQGDWIAVGTVQNIVQIASINYSTNTITLGSSINRSNGNSIWLYKKSDGVRTLYGTAPDPGSNELAILFNTPSPPTNLRLSNE